MNNNPESKESVPVEAGQARHQASVPAYPAPPEVTTYAASSSWDAATKRTVVVILLVAMVGIFWISRPVLPMLVIAGVVAYLLNPIVDLLERLRIPRSVSTVILFLLGLVAVILTPILLAPILLQQLASLNFDVPSTAVSFLSWLTRTFNSLPDTVEILGFEVPLDGVTQQFEAGIQNFTFIPTLAEILSYFQQLISTATNVVSSTAAIGVSVVGGIVQFLITFLVVFFLSLYLTKDAPLIREYVEGLFPRSYQSEWIDLLRRMGYIWQAFFRGQIILSVTVGMTTWLALTLAGMPGALILAILAGAMEVIPNLGPVLAMIPAVIVALIQGSTVLDAYGINNFGFALITIGIYFVIQQAENNILVPRIIGKGVNLHPIVVICGVAIGFNLAGVLGAFFAAPVIASLRVLGSYIHAKLLDYPPFLGQELPPPRRRTAVTYRRTVRGDELTAVEEPRPEHPDVQARQAPGSPIPQHESRSDGPEPPTDGVTSSLRA
ncbi:AI-2E family transporter [Litorilinea aerophila]|uniref:AI-2E family transporter n=1 Tax=Litorilinea aerophila TaxID=1204385 RepID=A0A540VDP4_9CHLR|nr:AI-2E family transporter [Litorilinea aerophila]MCC9077366.1 AI-2E family transporter [Litorilinea aerophila]GIV76240.1 MAG: AI-2E family transporter [Litorilinea sp.]